MTTHKLNINKQILSLFSGQASTVTTPKIYIELTKSHALAVVLNQCVFWSNKSSSSDGWFHKEYHEWFDEIHMPERTLRRRFDRLEQNGWISTKVKKVRGVNVKHIYTHVDRILESLSVMLSVDCPDRPTCPNGSPDEQNPCTKIAPTGQSGRLETAKMADSRAHVPYIADENFQIKTTNCEVSSSFFFSETLDQNLLSQKLCRDERSDSEFMDNVIEHVDNHSDKKFSRIVRAQGALKLLTRLKSENVIFYAKGKEKKETEQPKKAQRQPSFTPEELELVSAYNHAVKYNKIDTFMPDKEKQERAKGIIARMKAKEANACQTSSQPNNARANCLKSASSLVSHLS